MSEELATAAITWWQEDPVRLRSELADMYAWAPDLFWRQEGSGGWTGRVPLWPFDRPQPKGVTVLVDGRPFEVIIKCRPAHPMVVPFVWPRNVEPSIDELGWTKWHLLPNGSLCLLQGNADWNPSAHAAELIEKMSSWYIEYHLVKFGYIDSMTEYGIARDNSLDGILENITEHTREEAGERDSHGDEGDGDP
jgi:hypothetical protein